MAIPVYNKLLRFVTTMIVQVDESLASRPYQYAPMFIVGALKMERANDSRLAISGKVVSSPALRFLVVQSPP